MNLSCPDCVECRLCGYIAYCLADPPVSYPCKHAERLCDDCRMEGCEECRTEAERDEMFSGERPYEARLDPLHREGGTDRDTGTAWASAAGFDTTTNSYKPRKP